MTSHDNRFLEATGVLQTVKNHVSCVVFFSLSLSYSCTAVLPRLPSSCANRRQTYPGTLHLRAFPGAAYSRVSLLNLLLKTQPTLPVNTSDQRAAPPFS